MVKTTYKSLLHGKGMEIFKIYFTEWYSLKEASQEYIKRGFDENKVQRKLKKWKKKDPRNHRTVSDYFHKFEKSGWLDSKEVIKINKRFSKLGREHNVPNKYIRYRTNLNAFFDYIGKKYGVSLNKEERNILNLLADTDIRRLYFKFMKWGVDGRTITFFFIFLVENRYYRIPWSLIEKVTKPFFEGLDTIPWKECGENAWRCFLNEIKEKKNTP